MDHVILKPFWNPVFNTVAAQRGRGLTQGEAECSTRLGYTHHSLFHK